MPASHSGGFESQGPGVPPNTDAALEIATRLERSLRGAMPCVQCKYDLRGMSVLGVCPECGTAVRATILAVVDPLADALKPIRTPRLVAGGLLLWVGAFTLAMAAAWFSTVRHLLLNWMPGMVDNGFMAGWSIAIAALVLLAGLGAVGLTHPHEGDARRYAVLTWLGVLLHVPLAWIALNLGTVTARTVNEWQLLSLWEPVPERTFWRLAAGVTGLLIIVCLRPNARVLVARSLALRTGRVDRQTMLATGGAIVVLMIGDLTGLCSWVSITVVSKMNIQVHFMSSAGRSADTITMIAAVIMAMGAVLMTFSIIGSLIDAVRIARAIIRPGPSIQQVLGEVQTPGRRSAGGPA